MAAGNSVTQWFLYVLRCNDGSLYTGITTDVQRRLKEHNHHIRRAAHYTRARRPVHLVYMETCPSRSQALKREYTVRKMAKHAKERLVAGARHPCVI